MLVLVVDKDNKPLSNIIVEVIPKATVNKEYTSPLNATMKQIDKHFVPHILAVYKGSEVTFPNTDSVLHHVYSFSKAKTFEIEILKKDLERSVVLEQAGIVEIGCNIHDWMLGYIYVSNSPIFSQTNETGQARFEDLENGNYTVKAWHPRIQDSDIRVDHSVALNNKTVVKITLTKGLLPSYSDFDNVNGLGDY
jgi:plastocyanin